MPRAVGQIDEAKTEAILVAATELLSEKGASASMEEIARKAGVSRQTLYNRYPSKLDISRAVASRRSEAITAPLSEGRGPRETLINFASTLIERTHCAESRQAMRAVALAAPGLPELGLAIYEAGPAEGLKKLATWLTSMSAQGHLLVPDPLQAAEFFVGMANGQGHLRTLLGVDSPPVDIQAKAIEVTDRFLRAYAPPPKA